jgi:dTMP kinase
MHAKGKAQDKFERETPGFFERVRRGYLARAAAEPARFRLIDSTRPVADVRAELRGIVDAL